LEVLIKPIPSMPVTMAMPVVLSPKTLPSTIRNAAVKHRDMPKAKSARCHVLVLFNFCTSLFISNFILDIANLMLYKYNIKLFKPSYIAANNAPRKNPKRTAQKKSPKLKGRGRFFRERG
jgi:hypothetical protein